MASNRTLDVASRPLQSLRIETLNSAGDGDAICPTSKSLYSVAARSRYWPGERIFRGIESSGRLQKRYGAMTRAVFMGGDGVAHPLTPPDLWAAVEVGAGDNTSHRSLC